MGCQKAKNSALQNALDLLSQDDIVNEGRHVLQWISKQASSRKASHPQVSHTLEEKLLVVFSILLTQVIALTEVGPNRKSVVLVLCEVEQLGWQDSDLEEKIVKDEEAEELEKELLLFQHQLALNESVRNVPHGMSSKP